MLLLKQQFKKKLKLRDCNWTNHYRKVYIIKRTEKGYKMFSITIEALLPLPLNILKLRISALLHQKAILNKLGMTYI